MLSKLLICDKKKFLTKHWQTFLKSCCLWVLESIGTIQSTWSSSWWWNSYFGSGPVLGTQTVEMNEKGSQWADSPQKRQLRYTLVFQRRKFSDGGIWKQGVLAEFGGKNKTGLKMSRKHFRVLTSKFALIDPWKSSPHCELLAPDKMGFSFFGKYETNLLCKFF